MAKKVLSEQIADKIEDMIMVQQVYKGGDQIPPEMEMARYMDVSRTTIREAVKILCSRNILEIKRGNGTFVCENPGTPMDPLGYRFMDEEQLTNDMFEMSLLFEPVLVGLAAQKADEMSIELIQNIHDNFVGKMKRYRDGEFISPKEFRNLDVEFHKAVVESCENQVVNRSLPMFLANCTEWYNVWTNLDFNQVLESFEKYHPLILSAIKAHDPEKAKRYSAEHTQEIINIYRYRSI